MNHLSLFTGAGGGELAFQHLLKGFKTIGYVEYEDYCQRVIRQRIKDGLMHNAPIYGDIRTFIDSGCAKLYRGITDVISGGFPCQDISCANPKGKGLEGERSGLWKEMYKVICTIKPGFVFVENSPMLIIRGLGTILRDLATIGYNAKWCCLQASKVGANHKRDRIWIMAYAEGKHTCMCQKQGKHREAQAQLRGLFSSYIKDKDWRKRTISYKPRFIRNPDGVARKMDRIKAIGNGQVPQCASTAWTILTETLKEK